MKASERKRSKRRGNGPGNGQGNAGNASAGNAPENEAIVFKRAADTLPRGDVTLLLRTVLLDERETIYRQLVRGCRKSPAFAFAVVKEAADRIHGRPPQHIVAESRRVTIFAPEPPRDLKREAEEAAAQVVEAGAPAVDLTTTCPMLPAQLRIELPPPA